MAQQYWFIKYWNASILILNCCYLVPFWDPTNPKLLQAKVGKEISYPSTSQPTHQSLSLSFLPFVFPSLPLRERSNRAGHLAKIPLKLPAYGYL